LNDYPWKSENGILSSKRKLKGSDEIENEEANYKDNTNKEFKIGNIFLESLWKSIRQEFESIEDFENSVRRNRNFLELYIPVWRNAAM